MTLNHVVMFDSNHEATILHYTFTVGCQWCRAAAGAIAGAPLVGLKMQGAVLKQAGQGAEVAD